MKLLFCDNSYRNLINFRSEIIGHFLSDDHDVVIVAPDDCVSSNNGGYKYVAVDMERCGMNPIRDFKYFLSLLRTYKNERPDYIFHYTIKPNIYGSLAAKILGIPSTAMVTGMGYAFNHNDLRSKIAKVLYKIALGFNQNVLVLNYGNLEKLLELGIVKKDKVILLEGGEGVNLEKFK